MTDIEAQESTASEPAEAGETETETPVADAETSGTAGEDAAAEATDEG